MKRFQPLFQYEIVSAIKKPILVNFITKVTFAKL